MKNNLSGFEDFMHHLNDYERSNPEAVIQSFFELNSLPESQKLLSGWFRVMTGEDFDKLEDCDQNKMIKFFENLEKLVEASYLVKAKHSTIK
jgi:hypothetical protein